MPVAVDLSNVLDGTGGPLFKLEAGSTYNISKFPEDISQTPYFIVFRSVSKVTIGSAISSLFPNSSINNRINGNTISFGNGRGAFNVQASVPNHGFALPIPSNLVTAYNARYSDTSLGPIGAIGKRVGSNFNLPNENESFAANISRAVQNANISTEDYAGAGGSILLGAADTQLGPLIGGLATAAATRFNVPGTLLGSLLGAGASQFVTGALVGAKIARNPHLASVFQGVDFRTHEFEYKLIAKNKNESDTIRKLIRNFKYAMAPNYAAGFGDHIFEYPNEFDIIMAAGEYLFKFGRSVLTDFRVNYTGEGSPVFFEDSGAPYSVSINMSFKETSIVTKKEIGEGR